MGQAEQRLCGIEFFETFPAQELEALAKRCRWRRYAANQQIVGYHDDTKDVFLIVEGKVRVTIHSLSGKEVTFRDILTRHSV